MELGPHCGQNHRNRPFRRVLVARNVLRSQETQFSNVVQ